MSDFHDARPEDYRAVLRYLYGLPLLAEEEMDENDMSVPYLLGFWKEMRLAGDALAIPSLHKLTGDKYEIFLERILFESHDDTADGVASSWELANEMFELGSVVEEWASARDVVARFCCKRYTYLSKLDSFNKFCDAHPKLVRAMLDYAACHGGEAFE